MKISADVVSRKIEDEEVLLKLQTGTYFGVNATGSRILALIKEKHDREAIAAKLALEFEVALSEATRDVDDFLKHLENDELVCGDH